MFFTLLIRSGVYNRDRDLRRDSRVCDKIKSKTNARKAGKTDDTGYGSAPRWGEKQQRWNFARLQEVNGYDEVTSGMTMTGMGTTGQRSPWLECACVATGRQVPGPASAPVEQISFLLRSGSHPFLFSVSTSWHSPSLLW